MEKANFEAGSEMQAYFSFLFLLLRSELCLNLPLDQLMLFTWICSMWYKANEGNFHPFNIVIF